MPDIDVDQIGEALNNKMDRDLNNRSTTSGLRKLVASYIDGTEWCKVFAELQSDGTTRQWCEQGGFVATGGTVTYLQPFIDNNYTVVAQSVETSTYTTQYRQICPNSKTTTGLTGTSAQGGSLWWYACGYISGTTISGSTAISIEPSNESTPASGTVSNEVLQRITALEGEVNNMLGRLDYSNEVQFVLSNSSGSYTCLNDGFIKLQGASSTNKWTTDDEYEYLKYIGSVTVNNKTVLDVTVTSTGMNSNDSRVLFDSLNVLIPVSTGDVIRATGLPQSNQLAGTGVAGYYSFSFFPQLSASNQI